MSDEVSGELTLAFDMLQVDAEHLDGVFDCRARSVQMKKMH